MEGTWHDIFHGSNIRIDIPDLSKSKPFKDFGQGFYLSAVYEQAMERARQTTDFQQSGEPSVTKYDWNEVKALSGNLAILRFDDYCKEWAEFVLANRDRKKQHPIHNYDIVIGPIAGDGVTYQLRRYREGDISMEKLIDELKYAKGLTIQYFFGTERALATLRTL